MAKVGRFLSLLALLAPGCSSSAGPPCARISGQSRLADSPLALTANAGLLRAGDGFVLAGLDGNTIRWGYLREDGAILRETAFDLPELPAVTPKGQSLGPVFAVTQKTAPGDQLVTAMLVAKAGSPNTYEVHAYVHDPESSAPPALHILGDMVAAANSGTIRVVAGSPSSGKTALVLWGIESQPAPIRYQVLGAHGEPLGGVRTFLDYPDPGRIPRWTCVDISQGRGSLAVTLVEDPMSSKSLPLWHRFDLNDDGDVVGEALIYIRWGKVADCRIVSVPTPTSGGYLVAWQNSRDTGGTYFARMNPLPPDDAGAEDLPDVTSKPVLSSEPYGGYSRMPKLLWVAPVGAGYEFVIGMLGSRGPEVMRFNMLADPKGSTLHLPTAAGRVGPVSSWVGTDDTWVTYLDMPRAPDQVSTAPPGAVRRLVRISASESP